MVEAVDKVVFLLLVQVVQVAVAQVRLAVVVHLVRQILVAVAVVVMTATVQDRAVEAQVGFAQLLQQQAVEVH